MGLRSNLVQIQVNMHELSESQRIKAREKNDNIRNKRLGRESSWLCFLMADLFVDEKVRVIRNCFKRSEE